MIVGSFSAGWIPSQTVPDPYFESWDGRKDKEVPHHEKVFPPKHNQGPLSSVNEWVGFIMFASFNPTQLSNTICVGVTLLCILEMF